MPLTPRHGTSKGNSRSRGPDSPGGVGRSPTPKPARSRSRPLDRAQSADNPENSQASAIRVVVRLRPPLSPEEPELAFTAEPGGVVESADLQQRFHFDRSFGGEASQEEIFGEVGVSVVEDALRGYNGTILTYGPTGSGKTHCMFGLHQPLCEEGIAPRVVRKVFDQGLCAGEKGGLQLEDDSELFVEVSFLEVYREQVRDLLRPESGTLQIKEQLHRGFCVEGLLQQGVSSVEEALQLLRSGLRLRVSANTQMNVQSSRSHAICVLHLRHRAVSGLRRSKLTLVDLAGSEKVHKSGLQGENLEEARKINASLSALGLVIDALADRRPHVPYRDSRLTRLLEDSLGGNCRTTLLIACSPSAAHAAETLSSLRFGARASRVLNIARINLSGLGTDADRQLLQRIASLRRELASAHLELERRFAQQGPVGLSGGLPPPPPRSPSRRKAAHTLREGNGDPSDRSPGPFPRHRLLMKMSSAASLLSDEGPHQADDSIEPVPPVSPSWTEAKQDLELDSACNVPDCKPVGSVATLVGSIKSTATGSFSSSASQAGFSIGSTTTTPLTSWRPINTGLSTPPRRGFESFAEAGPAETDLSRRLAEERSRCAALAVELDRKSRESADLRRALAQAHCQSPRASLEGCVMALVSPERIRVNYGSPITSSRTLVQGPPMLSRSSTTSCLRESSPVSPRVPLASPVAAQVFTHHAMPSRSVLHVYHTTSNQGAGNGWEARAQSPSPSRIQVTTPDSGFMSSRPRTSVHGLGFSSPKSPSPFYAAFPPSQTMAMTQGPFPYSAAAPPGAPCQAMPSFTPALARADIYSWPPSWQKAPAAQAPRAL